jgi:Tol biopolymer transport system component
MGGIAVAIVVLPIAGYYLLRPRGEVAVQDAQLLPVSQWTADPGLSIAPAFSHDGKLVAYASDRGGDGALAIWLRPFPSGEARRLSPQASNDSTPDFSPADTRIVYRSEQDGGGIYIAPLSGTGQPRRLVTGGLRPRFSPHGKWVAYHDAGRIFIVSPDGGQPKQIQPEFLDSSFPVWSPDGQHLLFAGTQAGGRRDWWVTPVEGGAAKPTLALQTLRRVPAVHAPERWWREKILYSATEQQFPHLWEIPISSPDWQILGTPRQRTNGDAMEQVAAINKDGRLLFTRLQVTQDVWSIPVDANRGTPAGKPQQITGGGINQVPSITADGTKLAYVSNKTGVRDIWLRDSATGAEKALTRFARIGTRPALSLDGTRLVYPATTADGACSVVLTELGREFRASTLQGCFNIWGWSSDGLNLAIYNPIEDVRSVDLFNLAAGQRRPLLTHRSYRFFDVAFAPHGGWITFTAGPSGPGSQIYVAPFRRGAVLESEWIPITGEGGSFSAWSPDGGVLYFRSNRDGFQCIWSQKLDAAKRPAGNPVAVQHFHSISFGTYMVNPSDFHMSVAKDRLALNLAKGTANLWVTAKGE